MGPALYNWKHMVHDYVRFLVDDKWQWCRQCRRPVEHMLVRPEDDAPEELTCLDCGFVDAEALRSIPWPPAPL